jgi:hypothetical protein
MSLICLFFIQNEFLYQSFSMFYIYIHFRINRLVDLPRHKHLKSRSEFIMEQILWSDPRDMFGWEMSDRGMIDSISQKKRGERGGYNNISFVLIKTKRMDLTDLFFLFIIRRRCTLRSRCDRKLL